MGEKFCRIFMRSIEEEKPVYKDIEKFAGIVNDKTYQQLIALTFVLLVVVLIWMWYLEEG